MKIVLEEAEKSERNGEIPVACLIEKNDEILSIGINQVERKKDPTAHAEMIAVQKACNILDTKVLSGCNVYVNLEPCGMCATALVYSKISKLYFGAFDNKTGACGSVFNITNNKLLNHQIETYGGILEEKCSQLLKEFFKGKR